MRVEVAGRRIGLGLAGLRLAGLVVAGLVAAGWPAGAAPGGTEARACNDLPTVDAVDCIGAQTQAAKARLNRAFQALARAMPAGRRAALEQAQTEWVKFRDANCQFYGTAEGSIRQIEAAECQRTMAAARAAELERAGRP